MVGCLHGMSNAQFSHLCQKFAVNGGNLMDDICHHSDRLLPFDQIELFSIEIWNQLTYFC